MTGIIIVIVIVIIIIAVIAICCIGGVCVICCCRYCIKKRRRKRRFNQPPPKGPWVRFWVNCCNPPVDGPVIQPPNGIFDLFCTYCCCCCNDEPQPNGYTYHRAPPCHNCVVDQEPTYKTFPIMEFDQGCNGTNACMGQHHSCQKTPAPQQPSCQKAPAPQQASCQKAPALQQPSFQESSALQ